MASTPASSPIDAMCDTAGQVELNESDGSGLQPFRLAMALMSMLIASVALAHLFATALASARLRAHDRAVLRAVGVTNGQITAGTLTSTALSAACALAIGLPVGWFVQRVLGDAITAAIGVGPGASPEPPLGVVVMFAGITRRPRRGRGDDSRRPDPE